MTFAEFGTNLDLEIDESIGYWFNDDEKSYILNKAVDRFRDAAYREFEINQDARDKLRLLITASAPQVGNTFDLTTITDMTHILRLEGNFDLSCNGTTQSVKRRIKPEQIDDPFEQDPFEVGINADPKYEEMATTLNIKSDTAPTNVILTYLKDPGTVDITGNPTGTLLIPKIYDFEILSLARDIALENVNSPRYATSVNDTKTEI